MIIEDSTDKHLTDCHLTDYRRHWRGCRGSLLLLMLGISLSALADERIVRWVDADGITHFSDGQFAPAGAARVEIKPTNQMDAPVYTSHSRSQPKGRGPSVSVISLAPKQNVKGWRPRRESLYTGRKHVSRRSN